MEHSCPNCQATSLVKDPFTNALSCAVCGSSVYTGWGRDGYWSPPDGKLGRFELLERIGAGGFGTVWKARDTQLGRDVAIKIPHAGPQVPPEFAQRLLREGRSVSRLAHPHIVSVFEVGQDGPVPYMVCELVDGQCLSNILTHGELAWSEIAAIIAQIAAALDHAHNRGIVHRDVKPSNIMLCSASPATRSTTPSSTATPTTLTTLHAKLMDFGISLFSQDEATLLTVPGQLVGTPGYMSPEQLTDSHAVDHRTDVYSLGVVMYRLLTGRPPFHGSERVITHQVLHEVPVMPRQVDRQIPRELEAICMKAIDKQAQHRYGSAAEMAQELERYLSGHPVQARPLGTLGQLWLWCKRPERVRNAGIVGLAASIGMLGFELFGGIRMAWQLFVSQESHTRQIRVGEAAVNSVILTAICLAFTWLSVKVRAGKLWALWGELLINSALLLFLHLVLLRVVSFDMGGFLTVNQEFTALHELVITLLATLEVLVILGLIAWYANRPLFTGQLTHSRSSRRSPTPISPLPPQPLPELSQTPIEPD